MKDKTISGSAAKLFGGICELLTIIFTVLRACDVIAWKWWQVLMPVFISYGVIIIALIALGIVMCIASAKAKDDDL